MRHVDFSLKIRTLAVFFGLALISSTNASAADARAPKLLWPKESIAASQSTKALLIGHTGRAVKHAERALERAEGYDRMVALHNLCLGLIRQGDANSIDTSRTEQICVEAQTTSANYGYEAIVATNIELTRKANTRATNLAEAQP